MKFKFSFLAALMLCLLHVPAIAQEGPPVTVQVELTTLAFGGKVVGPLYYLNDGKTAKLRAYARGISRPETYVGSPALFFYETEADLTAAINAPPEERPEPFIRVDLSPAVRRAFLLFFPQQGRMVARVFEADADHFPPGSYRFINLSKKGVVLALGDKPDLHKLPAGEITLVTDPPLDGERFNVKVQMAQQSDEGTPELVYRSLWGFEARRRVLVFVVPRGEGEEGVEVLYFDEPAPNPSAASL